MRFNVNTLKYKVIALLACLPMAFAAAGPADTIKGFFALLKEGDWEGAVHTFISPTPPAEDDAGEIDASFRKLTRAYFGHVSYEIHEVTIEGDEASVNLTIHYPDGRVARNAAYALAVHGVADQLAGGEGLRGEAVVEAVIAVYQDEQLPMLSLRTDLILVQDDGWKILHGEGINENLDRVFAMFGE